MTSAENTLELLSDQRLMPTHMSSEQISDLPAQVRESAFFSAGVWQAEILSEMQVVVKRVASGELDGATARALIKSQLARLEYEAAPGDMGTIKDLRTDQRLNLIIDTNVAMARNYGAHAAGLSPGALAIYPCYELVRVGPMPVAPRDWLSRWVDAGGLLYNGRMVALKTDAIWVSISRFGLPYPPFDFNSGMRTRAIRLDEAETLGIIAAQTPQKTPPPLPWQVASESGGETVGRDFISTMLAVAGSFISFDKVRKIFKRRFKGDERPD